MSFVTFSEGLEARSMLSASPTLNAAVVADRLTIQADLLKFRSDALVQEATLGGDIAAIKADDVKDAASLKPLIATFHADVKAMWAQLKVDRLNEAQNVLADESLIVGDMKQILLDHGNVPALATDHANLLAHRIQLQNDMIAGLNARLATRQAAYQTIFSDGNAIVAAAHADSTVSVKLAADLQKWVTDKGNAMTVFAGDLEKLVSDRQQLVLDLTAMQQPT